MVAQSRVFARADEAARAHSSLACCHLSARIFIRFKEPELFYFYPPAAPKNFIKRSMMRPSRPTRVNSLREGPPTRRDLASDTLPPHFRSRSTSCFSPLSVPRAGPFSLLLLPPRRGTPSLLGEQSSDPQRQHDHPPHSKLYARRIPNVPLSRRHSSSSCISWGSYLLDVYDVWRLHTKLHTAAHVCD